MIESDFNFAPEEVKRQWGESGDPNPEANWDDFLQDLSEASTKVRKEKWGHFTPQFVDTNTPSGDEISQALTASEERRKLYKEQSIFQMEGEAIIDTTMPVTVFPIGDIHFGSVYSNTELWEHHRKTISETPGAYVVFLHNLVDNDIKFKNNNMPNSIPPWEQFRVMQKWIKDLDGQGKVLGAIWSDCHEGWSMAQTGTEAEKLLYGYEGRKFPVIENGGILNLQVADEKYQIGLYHKQGPFNSNFNPEHALRQNRRLRHEGRTDAEIGAHYHNTAASANYEGAKTTLRPVHYIRVGTYKGVPFADEKDYVTDRWAVEKFGTTGQTPGTALMFWNDKHNIDNSIDFETAMEKHLAVRTYALVKEMGLDDRLSALMK